ncbi:NAD(P)-binding domain-containing protein [Ruegeria arenilitoris]|uniref:NAD(P)-binding domain-containing protein n=1 Tax=Ruegeria arenilitoris TaxID=1173585 RepID=UPI00147FFA67|nr:NAD(P)-binding domain-containing protein [Ruegeria arenilitoris]
MSDRLTTVVVIGAGHAGLAMSRCIAERGIDHVVLERGKVANSWRTERWDSLRLLTPNWCSRLPGYAYVGDDPDGYMNMAQLIDFIGGYASAISAPVETGTTVTSVREADTGFRVETDRGAWHCRAVVLASGACNVPAVPKLAGDLPKDILSIDTKTYRRPSDLPDGGVMVVGGSATGTQLAREIHRSGRPVILSTGEHVRLPRVYRGRDILWWMDACGLQDETYLEVEDLERARTVPSLQLTGTDTRDTLDLNALTDEGVRLAGKLAGLRDGSALFSGSLNNVCALADLKMNRLLTTVDEWATEAGLDGTIPDPHRFETTRVPNRPPLTMKLCAEGIRSIVWATGYRPDYSWLHVPVFDRKGRVRHNGGVVDMPGMYLMGMQFLRRRKSSLIDGAGDDAGDLAAHLADWLDGRVQSA